jgi:Zinc carboxypeptidase
MKSLHDTIKTLPLRLSLCLPILLPALGASALTAQGEADLTAPTGIEAKSWDRFHDYKAVVELMQAMQKRWPEYISLAPIGKSVQGRTLWVMTVNDKKTGKHTDKPAMYVDANIHGNEVQGTEAALYMVWYMLRFAPRVPRLQKILSNRVFYIVPSVNPDGRDYWFHKANTASSSRGGQAPVDSDGDGLFDEDPPNDLNGDGNITMMRKKVPMGEGRYRLDPTDPRLMIRVGKGEKGDYNIVGSEGLDDDGDGRINEDGPGGYDPNRDWGSDWQPAWLQRGARPLPFGLPESRAVRDFLLAHPNVAGVQAYHNMGGMILRGPGSKHVDYAAGDKRPYDILGKKGEELIPFYRYLVLWDDLYTVHGGFVDWTYMGLGILSFTNEMWTRTRLDQGRRELDRTATTKLARDLTFDSHLVPWKEFDHPLYGKVEIGGTVKNSGRIPPAFLIQEMLHRNSAFVLYQTEELPEVKVHKTTITSAGADLYYVDLVLENLRVTPTRTAQAAKHHIGRPDLLVATGEGSKILSASRFYDDYRKNQGTPLPKEIQPNRIPINEGIGSNGKLRIRYLVQGKGTMRLGYEAEKAKNLEFEIPIR